MGKGLPKSHKRGKFSGHDVPTDFLGGAGGIDWSTSETDTGLLWIDGEAVYQKTLKPTLALNGGTHNIAHGITGLADVLDVLGAVKSGAGVWRPLPYVTTAGTSFHIEIQQVTATEIILSVGTGWNRSTGAVSLDDPALTIRYTKT